MSEKIDFIATVITPWHLIGVEALMIKMKQEGIDLNSKIIVQKHQFSGYLLKEKDLHHIDAEVVFEEHELLSNNAIMRTLLGIKQSSKIRKYIKTKNQNKLFLVNPWHINTEKITRFKREDNDIINIIIDEGLALYINDQENILYDKDLSAIKKTVRKNRYKKITKFEEQLETAGKLQRFTLFEKNENKITVNDSNKKYYEEAIRSRTQDINRDAYKEFNDCILINTQTYTSDGTYSSEQETEVIKWISDEAKKRNTRVVIKPHPRDDDYKRFEGLDVEVNNFGNKAQEELLTLFTPKSIVGIISTSLVTANALFGIKAVSFNKLISGDIRQKEKNDFEKFNNLFDEIVDVANSKEELIKSIFKEG